MQKKAIWGFLLLALLTLPACLGDRFSGPAACNEDGVLFVDDFAGEQNCGWQQYAQGGAQTKVTDGVLRVSSSQPGQIWWTNPGKNFDNVIVSVQARQVSGPDDNAYGVICRYQNEENFYVFLISGDGYYAIAKYQTGVDQIQYLTGEGQFQPSDAINQGAATNEVRASCIGNQLSLAVNGLPLVSVNDPTFVIGDVGVAASTFQPGTAEINFDNFRVVRP